MKIETFPKCTRANISDRINIDITAPRNYACPITMQLACNFNYDNFVNSFFFYIDD